MALHKLERDTPADSGPARLASLWIGERLSPLEQTSALSFLELGHELTLYVTEPVEGVPPGVNVRDAREVLNTRDIVRHRKTGSPALHSDLFRFALMRSTQFMWVDLDIICLKRLTFHSPYVFGLETSDEVNGAVLRLPSNSLALKDLLVYDEQTVGYPAHLTRARRFKYFLKSWGRGLPITEWPWGSIGPRGLSFHLRLHGEFRHALPVESFYPIPLREVDRFIEPGGLSRADFSERTYAVHLWGKELRETVKRTWRGQVPPSSFLGQEISRQSAWSGFSISTCMS